MGLSPVPPAATGDNCGAVNGDTAAYTAHMIIATEPQKDSREASSTTAEPASPINVDFGANTTAQTPVVAEAAVASNEISSSATSTDSTDAKAAATEEEREGQEGQMQTERSGGGNGEPASAFNCNKSQDAADGSAQANKPPRGSEVFVGGLAKDANEADLYAAFSTVGEIFEVRSSPKSCSSRSCC